MVFQSDQFSIVFGCALPRFRFASQFSILIRAEQGTKRLYTRRLANEHVLRKLPVAKNRIADLRPGVVIESYSGEVLEAEVFIGIDLCAGDPRAEVAAAA